MKNENWNIKPVQEAVLSVFRAFEQICTRHNLRYYAAYGTALGAIRHHGFIPWDDDCDVLMPREDYNKFVQLVQHELPEHLVFMRGGGHPLAPIHFGRMFDNTNGIVEKLSRESNLTIAQPPFLDIFILEGCPTCVQDIRKWWFVRQLYRLCQIYRFPWSTVGYSKIKLILCRVIGFFVSLTLPRTSTNEEMMVLCDKLAMKVSYDAAFYVVEPQFFRSRVRRLIPKYIFAEARVVAFCGGTIRVPSHAEEYLMHIYGDYMKLPPKEQQIPEHSLGYRGGMPSWNPE